MRLRHAPAVLPRARKREHVRQRRCGPCGERRPGSCRTRNKTQAASGHAPAGTRVRSPFSRI